MKDIFLGFFFMTIWLIIWQIGLRHYDMALLFFNTGLIFLAIAEIIAVKEKMK